MSELVHTYTKYVAARRDARKEASLRVREEIQADLIEVGRAVLTAQKDGMSIADIARVMGIKNRNFIYDAKRAYAEHTGEDPQVRTYVRKPNEKQEDSVGFVQVDEKVVQSSDYYTIDPLSETEYEVFAFGESTYLHYDERAKRVIAPEEWADASQAQRIVYRDAIKDIESRHRK